MIYLLKNWQKIKRGYRFGVKTSYSLHHLGVDYIVPKNTPIYAPIKCKIIVSNEFPQGGKTVHVALDDHKYGRLVMRCMHLNKLLNKGSYNEGDIIGYTGNTGKLSTGPHLHLDISKDKVNFKNFSNFIDPDKYFASRINNKLNINNTMKLIKILNSKTPEKVYAIGKDNKRHWIFNQGTLNIGKEMGLWGDEIKNIQSNDLEEGHTIFLIK